MAQIARGSNGQASYTGPSGSGSDTPSWTISYQPPTGLAGIVAYSPGGEGGWVFSSDGSLFVPASVQLGNYSGIYQASDEGKTYSWEVTEPPCNYSIFHREVIRGNDFPGEYTMQGGVSMAASGDNFFNGVNYYYPCNYVIDWGDGNTSSGTASPYFIAGMQGPLHTYAATGTYAVTVSYSSTHGECSATQTVSGNITILPSAPRWFCEGGNCVEHARFQGSTEGHGSEADCRTAGCGESQAGPFVCLPTAYGTNRCTNQIPADYLGTRYTRLDECEEGCTDTPEPEERFFCVNGDCVGRMVSDGTGHDTREKCFQAGCTGDILYKRYRCEDGNCVEFFTLNPTEGYDSCFQANCGGPPVEDCQFTPPEIHVDAGTVGDPIKAYVLSQPQLGWILELHYTLNGQPQATPTVQAETADAGRVKLYWQVPRTAGLHNFLTVWIKAGCPNHVADIDVTIPVVPPNNPYWCVGGACVQAATAPSGATSGPHATAFDCSKVCGSGGGGGGGGGDCPPCPPCLPCPTPADPFTAANTVAIESPSGGATLKNFVLISVKVTDPNEQTDSCHHNYDRPCNHESDGPALQLFLGGYSVPLEWKLVPESGTPLNGTWEALLDTRDYSNGAHTLRVSMRGVGCCRKESTVNVSLVNTLQGNIFYRDTYAQAPAGFVVPDAMLGVETRALALNTSRRYWEQWGVRSGTTLDGAYKHDDWPKHQPVLPVLGAQWNAQGERFERHNYSAHVTFRLPLDSKIRFRRKWTPQFFLSAFDLEAQSVAKIRQVEPGTHFVWTQNPPRAHLYDGEKITLLGDFNQNTSSSGTNLGNTYAPDAVDAALWESEEGGRKIIVITPESEEHPNGEMFAFDPDSDDVALNYSVRNHPLVPRFVEVVKNIPIALYARSTLTHAYDLRFGAPKLKWTHPDQVTLCTVDDNTLFVAFNTKLYSTDGLTAPTLVREFASPVTAATKTFVGLQNGQVWKKNESSNSWTRVHARSGPITGLTKWSAGTALQGVPGLSEAQTDDARGVVAGEGDWLLGEHPDGSWFDERQLIVPTDLVGKSVQRVSALDHFSITVAAPQTTDDATQLPAKDERLLIGTAESGLLFVYQRSLLSEKDGAIPVSHDTIPRVFPFWIKP